MSTPKRSRRLCRALRKLCLALDPVWQARAGAQAPDPLAARAWCLWCVEKDQPWESRFVRGTYGTWIPRNDPPDPRRSPEYRAVVRDSHADVCAVFGGP